MTFMEKEPNKQSISSEPNMSTDDSSEDNAQDDLDFSNFSGNLYENHPDLVEQTRAFGNDYEPPSEPPNSPVADEVSNDVSFEPDDLDFGDGV